MMKELICHSIYARYHFQAADAASRAPSRIAYSHRDAARRNLYFYATGTLPLVLRIFTVTLCRIHETMLEAIIAEERHADFR